MPRQPKTKKNITTTPLDSYDALVEATNDIDESPTDVQCEDITPSDSREREHDLLGRDPSEHDGPVEEVKPTKPKRAPKKKASAQHSLLMSMIGNHLPATVIKDKEPVTPIKDKEPIIISEDEKTPEKNVKVIELTQCEKCGKKLTARTLKYSHMRV